MHLGATELFHSVTPTGSGYIYPRAIFLEISPTCFARAQPALPPGSPIASCLTPLVSAAVNGNHPHRCRCSEFIAELGYELDHYAILI